jgi:hypothetical protein
MQGISLFSAIQQGSLPQTYAGTLCNEGVECLNAYEIHDKPSRNKRSGSKRNIQNALHFFINLFEQHQIDYALVGILAFGLYARDRSRVTELIEFLIHKNHMPLMRTLLNSAAMPFTELEPNGDNQSIVTHLFNEEIIINAISTEPISAAIIDINTTVLFNQPIKVIKPELLLWQLLQSSDLSHVEPATNLLQAGQINIESMLSYFQWANQHELVEPIKAMINESKRVKRSYAQLLAAKRASPSQKPPVYIAFKK